MAWVGLRVPLEKWLGPTGASRFTDEDLRRLWEGGYETLEDLQIASQAGLERARLRPARADQIIHAQGTADGTERAGVAAGQSLGGTADAGYFADLFPSALYYMAFTLYDGVGVAMRLVSHAKANGFRGEVRHVSTSRSDFTLLLKTDDVGKQTLKGFASWLATQVPVRVPGAEASTAFAKAAEGAGGAARVEVTSDPFNPLTRDRGLLDMYNQQGWLAVVYATTEVREALEKANNTEAEQRERLSESSSLGESGASSSHAGAG